MPHHTRDFLRASSPPSALPSSRGGRRHEARIVRWSDDFASVRDLVNWMVGEGHIMRDEALDVFNAPHRYHDMWARYTATLGLAA